MILLDANILLRMTDSSDPNYKTALDAVFKARTATKLVIAHQSLYEFCAVATRAKSANGLDMDRPRMSRWISRYRQLFDLLPEPPSLLDHWLALIATYSVTGFQVHDARYVALMQCHRLTDFMTYNTRHFAKYPISLIDPHTF